MRGRGVSSSASSIIECHRVWSLVAGKAKGPGSSPLHVAGGADTRRRPLVSFGVEFPGELVVWLASSRVCVPLS
jgi:hypothetical protein